MLPLSSLTQRITPAGTAAFIEASERVRLQGGDVISLAAAEPFTAISPEVNRAAIDVIEREATRFSGISGTQALKAALQDKFLQGNGLHYDSAQILVANGSKPLMAAALFALLEPGDEVVLPAPYYNAHHELVILADGRPVSVPTYAQDRFIVQPDALAAAIGPRTRAVFFSNPNNPAGSTYTAEDWLQLAPVLLQHPQLALLIDEIFENWAFGERVKASAPAVLPALQERTVLINGFSKGFSMNGWRLGFAAGPTQLIQAMEDIQTHLSGQPSPIVQAGAVAALRHHGQPSTQELDAARQLRDEATALLNRIAGLRCHVPDATFLLFPDCSAALGQRSASGRVLHTDTDYALALLAETGVAVVPGSDFGTAGHFRMSCAKGRDTVLEAIGRIAQFHQGLQAV